jgi:hypothetical protein
LVLRIKSRWTEKAKLKFSEDIFKENAQALAYIYWRLALDNAKNLHGEDFIYDTDQQRIYVIGEYLAMLLQVADRLMFGRLEDDDRHVFINTLAVRLSDHMQDNCEDLFGPGDYRESFIDMINRRSEAYSEFDYSLDDGPSYSFLQYFGSQILRIMEELGGEHHENRWVIDQIMDIDAPETIEKATRAIEDLFS